MTVPPAIAGKQDREFPRLALLKSLQLEAQGIIAARARAQIAHKSQDIRSSGDIVESAVRDAIARRLPSRYTAGNGHIVSPLLHSSPQLDAILYDSSRYTPLYQGDDGTDWLPRESVVAFGEIKASYAKYKHYVPAFAETIRRTKAQLGWPKTRARATSYGSQGLTESDVEFTHLFTFMVFVESAELDPTDLEDLYRRTPIGDLPTVLYLVDRGLLLNMKFGGTNGDYPMEMNLYPEIADSTGLTEYKSRWCLRQFADDDADVGLGLALFTFIYLLISHLSEANVPAASLLPYYSLAQRDVGPRMHYHILE